VKSEYVARATVEDLDGKPQASALRRSMRRTPLLHAAAAIGVLLFVFEMYLFIKWFGSSYFEPVRPGPTPVPGWMKIGINVVQIAGIPILAGCLLKFLVQPWIKERRVPVDGLLCLALALASVYDPLSAYFRNWLMYNSYFINWGSPLPGGIPGWRSFAEPGAMVAWPVVFIVPAYVYTVLGGAKMGCWLIGRARTRWPNLSAIALVGISFAAGLALVLTLECQIYMRLGFYAEVGTPAINGGHFYQNPLANVLFASVMLTAMSSFRFFTDDRDQTIVERGAERVRSVPKRTALRFFAIVAAVQLILLGTYHIPMALWKRHDQNTWSADTQQRSYLTNHLCGVGTARICPPDP